MQNCFRSTSRPITGGAASRSSPANCGAARIRLMPSPIPGTFNSMAR